MEERIKEILARKKEIRTTLQDGTKEVDLDEINQELDNLTNEQETIERRMRIAENLQNSEVEPDNVEEIPDAIDDQEERGCLSMKSKKKASNMSKEVRSFLKYMISGGKEMRGVTLSNGQAVVPEELDTEIITEMREVSDVMDFINLKNVRGNLRVGNLTSIEGNKDADGDTIQSKGGVTGDITFGSYRTSAKIELGVGLDAESLDAFKEIVISELALSLAIEIEKEIMNGTGSGQAEGLFTVELPSTQKISVSVDSLTHKELAKVKGKIRRAYGKRASYVINTETFHEQIEGMVGSDGHPIYNENNELLLKKPVIISDEAPKNKILFGYGKRYWYNYNMPPQIASSGHEKFSDGMIVHRALAFGDGHVMDKKAFAVLELTAIAG